MRISDVMDASILLHTSPASLTNEYVGAYVGDFLSIVMKSAKSGNLLVTVNANMNTVAVAVLMDLPAILFTETDVVSPVIIEKANAEGIAVLSTVMTSLDAILNLKERSLL
jgi:hypothetical protein